MKLTILGSGGCMVIPKPLCDCHVCKEAREKGVPDDYLSVVKKHKNISFVYDGSIVKV